MSQLVFGWLLSLTLVPMTEALKPLPVEVLVAVEAEAVGFGVAVDDEALPTESFI